jgi:hypothetical protein
MQRIVTSLLVVVFFATTLRASQNPDQKHIDSIKKKVASCLENSRHVTIETYDDRKLQGLIGEAESDSFVLVFQSKSTTLNYADVKKIKWPSTMSREVKAIIIATAGTAAIFLAVVLLGGLRG